MIDFYFVQFYNQGDTQYNTYDGLFIKATGTFAGTSVKEIASRGVPLQKIVVGKPLTEIDATNTGFVNQTVLGQWTLKAFDDFGWFAGAGHWQFKSDLSGKGIRNATSDLMTKCINSGKCTAANAATSTVSGTTSGTTSTTSGTTSTTSGTTSSTTSGTTSGSTGTITESTTTTTTTALDSVLSGSTNNLRNIVYPARVAYIDTVNNWTDIGILRGLGIPGYADSKPSDYNYIMLAFWFCDGNKALDMALYWQKFS